jgi:hypothetical protein
MSYCRGPDALIIGNNNVFEVGSSKLLPNHGGHFLTILSPALLVKVQGTHHLLFFANVLLGVGSIAMEGAKMGDRNTLEVRCKAPLSPPSLRHPFFFYGMESHGEGGGG